MRILSPATHSRPLVIWPAASRRVSSAENCCADATFGASTTNIAAATPIAVEIALEMPLLSLRIEVIHICLDQSSVTHANGAGSLPQGLTRRRSVGVAETVSVVPAI